MILVPQLFTLELPDSIGGWFETNRLTLVVVSLRSYFRF